MEPNAHMGHSISGVGHFETAKYEEAILNLKKAIKLAPYPDLYMYSLLGRAYACNNEPEKAKEVLKQMEGWRGKQGGGYSYFGYLYADLKDWDQAITNLEMAVNHHEGFMLFFHVSPFVSHPEMKGDT